MKPKVDIQQLVKLASAGDVDAFGKLYDMYLDAVYRFVYVRVGNKPDAEDITEQIFVSMFTAINRYVESNVSVEAWIYRIARNKVIDYYRTHKSHVQLEQIAETADPSELPEDRLATRLSHEAVMKGLRHISPKYQEIIILKFIEDKTNEEISALLSKPVAHVRVLQHRAIQALRKKLHYD